MTETQPTERPIRDEHGRFLPGNPGGPGRPRRPSGYTIATYKAAEEGVDLQAEVWKVLQALIERGKMGDVQAARAVFSILLDDGADLRVEVDDKAQGPPEPAPGALSQYLNRLHAAAQKLTQQDGGAPGS